MFLASLFDYVVGEEKRKKAAKRERRERLETWMTELSPPSDLSVLHPPLFNSRCGGEGKEEPS